MPIDLSIPATGKITLFVEDTLTRDYLRRVWEEPTDLEFRLGGGNDGVRALVKSFEDEGHPNVFGVTDRDFRPANDKAWFDERRTFRTFVLPVHEIENYLLDAHALCASRFQNRGLDAGAIEEWLREKANALCWWAACRETIAELKRRFREPFVADPSQAVIDQESACNHIINSPWYQKLDKEVDRSREDRVRTLLSENHDKATNWHADGTWRREFAGKELLRHVAGRMWDQTKRTSPLKPDANFYADLAKGIGDWQVNNGAIPLDLTNLLSAIRGRIARLGR
jgi:hypothetical protein